MIFEELLFIFLPVQYLSSNIFIHPKHVSPIQM